MSHIGPPTPLPFPSLHCVQFALLGQSLSVGKKTAIVHTRAICAGRTRYPEYGFLGGLFAFFFPSLFLDGSCRCCHDETRAYNIEAVCIFIVYCPRLSCSTAVAARSAPPVWLQARRNSAAVTWGDLTCIEPVSVLQAPNFPFVPFEATPDIGWCNRAPSKRKGKGDDASFIAAPETQGVCRAIRKKSSSEHLL